MSDYVVSDTNLTAVANAIRTKGGTSGQLTFPTGFVDAIAAIPSGGGASNVVTGTFKGTTTDAAMDVNIPYTGSGYPVAIIIYPTEGPYNIQTGSFYSIIQRYATATYLAVKTRTDEVPDYAGGNGYLNRFNIVNIYKSNATSATTYSTSTSLANSSAIILRADDAANSTSNMVRMSSAKKMSVYIASTSYGFAANIDYTYYIVYSS